jgi:hypothetical protein
MTGFILYLRYIVKTMKKIRYINDIFEKEQGKERYTNDAILLQDLLRYSLEINEVPSRIDARFKKRDLQNWIIRNNKEILDYYHKLSKRNTTISNRIHAREARMNDKFETLLHMNLIRPVGTASAEKIKIPVTLYSYTKGGILLALISKTLDLKKVIAITKAGTLINKYQNELERIFQWIYQVFAIAFNANKNPSASEIFHHCLFEQLKIRGLNPVLVNRIYFTLVYDNNLLNFVDLLHSSLYSPFFNENSSSFVDAFYDTIESLDTDIKKLVLHQIKIVAENRFRYILENIPRQYEELPFGLRSDYERIAAAGYCNSCDCDQAITLHYLDLKRISLTNGGDTNWTCPICRSEESLTIRGLGHSSSGSCPLHILNILHDLV